MRPPRRSTRGFILHELILMLVLASIALGALAKLMLEGVHLQRIAGEHANRVSAVDALARRIRTDAASASAYEWSPTTAGGVLTLETHVGDERSLVGYRITSTTVTRLRHGTETGSWQARRLSFDAELEPGRDADLLHLQLTDIRPARARGMPNRRRSLPVLLPHRATVAQPVEEGDP